MNVLQYQPGCELASRYSKLSIAASGGKAKKASDVQLAQRVN
jgi:hypothetical protein